MFKFRLRRRKLVNIYDKYINKILNYRKDDIPKKDISKLLNKLEVTIRRHKYNNDINFTSKGRRNFLKGEIVDYLKDNNYKDAFGDLHEYLVDQSYCYPSTSDFDTLEEARLVQDYNQVYANKGIVCMEDKDNILELIHLFRYYLKINRIV